MFACLPQHGGGPRREVGVAVDLAVRMGQRHPDLLAAVLEAEHLLDAGHGHQVGGAVPPRLDDQAGVRRFQLRERCGVVAGKADHLAAAVPGSGHEAVAGGRTRRLARRRTGSGTGSRRRRRRSRGRAPRWSVRSAPDTAGTGRAAACRCGLGAAPRRSPTARWTGRTAAATGPGHAAAAACGLRPAPGGARATRRTAGHGHRPASPASAPSRCRRLAWSPRRSSGNHVVSSRREGSGDH